MTSKAQLQQEIVDLKRVLADSVRFIFLVAPALTPVLGSEPGLMTPTTDHQGVMFTTTNPRGKAVLNVTVIPASETLVITGVGTLHRLEIHAPEGKLSSEQIVDIVANVHAIEAVQAGKADPLLDGIDLLGHAKVAVPA